MRPLIRRTRYRPIWLSDCGICDKAALEAKHRKAAFDFARVFKPDPLPPGDAIRW